LPVAQRRTSDPWSDTDSGTSEASVLKVLPIALARWLRFGENAA
jgi:hypothetical protein